MCKPWQIKRVASADAVAEKIRALAEIDVADIQRRALIRFVNEQTLEQQNIESISFKAIEDLGDDAKPEEMEQDWISNFFKHARLISDSDMQSLWSRVLTGEAERPGTYSKRTVNFLSSIDKRDAELFTCLCAFTWFIRGNYPLVFDVHNEIYNQHGINFGTLKHLDEIGLLSFQSFSGFAQQNVPTSLEAEYFGVRTVLELPNNDGYRFDVGKVLLSQVGRELAPISGAKAVPEFHQYVLNRWSKHNFKPHSRWPNK